MHLLRKIRLSQCGAISLFQIFADGASASLLIAVEDASGYFRPFLHGQPGMAATSRRKHAAKFIAPGCCRRSLKQVDGGIVMRVSPPFDEDKEGRYALRRRGGFA